MPSGETMRRRFQWLLLGVVLLGFSGPVTAETKLSGKVKLDKRFVVNDWFGGEDFSTPIVGMHNLAELKL